MEVIFRDSKIFIKLFLKKISKLLLNLGDNDSVVFFKKSTQKVKTVSCPWWGLIEAGGLRAVVGVWVVGDMIFRRLSVKS